jgi:hypothetical protein
MIDIEARAVQRMTAFNPGYARRTDTDKPGKPWPRPNDGPAPDREAKAAELRALLLRPKAEPQAPKVMPERTPLDQIIARGRTVRYLAAVVAGAQTNREAATAMGEQDDHVRYVCDRAVERGYLTKGALEQRGKIRVAPLTITPAGRAFLEAHQ